MAFYISQFVKNVKRNDLITFVNGSSNDDVYVNLDLLSFYTTFFLKKDGFIVDNNYEIPFDVKIAISALNHLHTLFIELVIDQNMFFKMLVAFDYFCIDVSEIYNSVLYQIVYHESMLLVLIKDAITVGSVLSMSLLNKLFDLKYINHCHVYNNDKDTLLFLLKRKWLISSPLNKETFSQRAMSLELYLFQSIISYIEKKNENEKKEIIELWEYVNPLFLPKETLCNFSNHPLSTFVSEKLKTVIHQKFRIFSNSPLITFNRFYIRENHLQKEDFVIGKSIQAMDKKNKWYNAKIIDINNNEITVNFDNFASIHNEIISINSVHRFLPYDTIKKEYICPCELCIYELFVNDKNIYLL